MKLVNDLEAGQKRECYKVITQDKSDEIVDIYASLMMGVALQVCKLEQARTNWQGTLGILTNGT